MHSVVLIEGIHNIALSWAMAGVVVFPKPKPVTSIDPGFDDRLNNLVNIHALRHLVIFVAVSVVEGKKRLEVIPDSCPRVHLVHIFHSW